MSQPRQGGERGGLGRSVRRPQGGGAGMIPVAAHQFRFGRPSAKTPAGPRGVSTKLGRAMVTPAWCRLARAGRRSGSPLIGPVAGQDGIRAPTPRGRSAPSPNAPRSCPSPAPAQLVRGPPAARQAVPVRPGASVQHRAPARDQRQAGRNTKGKPLAAMQGGEAYVPSLVILQTRTGGKRTSFSSAM